MFKPNSDNSQKFVLSCNTGDTDLPLIEVKIANSFKSLIGTGAILSLIQPGTVEQLKKVMKINFISLSVNIKTLVNSIYHTIQV